MLSVATYWRTNLTMRQIGLLFGISHSAVHRVLDTLGPLLAHAQAAELEAWLEGVTAAQLAARAPVPGDDVWPPYARGRSVRQCLGTVLNETFEHHGFCVRDLDLIEAQSAG